MSVWVIVGGQFGSEGKGKVAAYIARKQRLDFCVRCGGPNSGHSITTAAGVTEVFRQLPTGAIAGVPRLLIAPGALIDLDVLRFEIEHFNIRPGRLGVDRNCFVIERSDRERERRLRLRQRLGSTLSGVGGATSRRVLRAPGGRTAASAATENAWLASLLTDVGRELNDGIDDGRSALIEGTQGFGLSLYHGGFFPQCTSRDTTASAFLSEAGLAPSVADHVILVFRTFPIRVPGNSGPLAGEVSWGEIRTESGYPHEISELTSVTKMERRVGRFDWAVAERAVMANRPTSLAVNGLDYLSYADSRASSPRELSDRSQRFLAALESRFRVSVGFAGTGPCAGEIIAFENDPPLQVIA